MTKERYVFRELNSALASSLGIDPLPIPVRADRDGEVFGGSTVDLGLVIEELRLFVEAHPDDADHYGPLVARLAHIAGVAAGREGDTERAERLFRIGAAHDPGSVVLHANLGLAHQVRGQHREAVAAYATARDAGDANPLALILAGRAHMELGEHAEALALFDECPSGFWDDDGFRDLYLSVAAEANDG